MMVMVVINGSGKTSRMKAARYTARSTRPQSRLLRSHYSKSQKIGI